MVSDGSLHPGDLLMDRHPVRRRRRIQSSLRPGQYGSPSWGWKGKAGAGPEAGHPLVFIAVWKGIGYIMVIYLAGFRAFPGICTKPRRSTRRSLAQIPVHYGSVDLADDLPGCHHEHDLYLPAFEQIMC